MALTATTPFVLNGLISELIRGTTPRVTYQQASGWEPYTEQVGSASRSRRFRLVWEEGNFHAGGIFTRGVETSAILRVRTDYVGEHQQMQFMREDDKHQLRDRIHTLSEDSTTGFVLIEPDGIRTERPPDWDSANAGQWDHVYPIRYLRARG